MVRMATYGPGIDQLQHAKSVSHIIICYIAFAFLHLVSRIKAIMFPTCTPTFTLAHVHSSVPCSKEM